MWQKSRFGFTLAELLIALAILGLIATFAIPKILSSQQSGKKTAVFRETYATLSDTVKMARLKGEVVWDGPELNAYAFKNINHVKACSTDSEAEGCWAPASATCGSNSDEPGMILHNGASLVGFDLDAGGPGSYSDSLGIDWNGLAGPNIEGDDQLCIYVYINVGGSRTPGTIRASTSTASTTLFEQIFGQ